MGGIQIEERLQRIAARRVTGRGGGGERKMDGEKQGVLENPTEMI